MARGRRRSQRARNAIVWGLRPCLLKGLNRPEDIALRLVVERFVRLLLERHLDLVLDRDRLRQRPVERGIALALRFFAAWRVVGRRQPACPD